MPSRIDWKMSDDWLLTRALPKFLAGLGLTEFVNVLTVHKDPFYYYFPDHWSWTSFGWHCKSKHSVQEHISKQKTTTARRTLHKALLPLWCRARWAQHLSKRPFLPQYTFTLIDKLGRPRDTTVPSVTRRNCFVTFFVKGVRKGEGTSDVPGNWKLDVGQLLQHSVLWVCQKKELWIWFTFWNDLRQHFLCALQLTGLDYGVFFSRDCAYPHNLGGAVVSVTCKIQHTDIRLCRRRRLYSCTTLSSIPSNHQTTPLVNTFILVAPGHHILPTPLRHHHSPSPQDATLMTSQFRLAQPVWSEFLAVLRPSVLDMSPNLRQHLVLGCPVSDLAWRDGCILEMVDHEDKFWKLSCFLLWSWNR